MTIRYRLGTLTLEPSSRRLVDGAGAEISLEPRVFDLLTYLVERPDRVVDKQELWQEVWDSRPVTDSVIPHAVSKLRKALEPYVDGDVLAAVHGRGYRLTLTPERIVASDFRPARATIVRSRVMTGALTIAVLALAVTALFRVPDSVAERPRVAVLPVENQTGSSELDWSRLGLLPLVEQALAESGVDPVSTGTVLSTLRRYPDLADPVDQARRIAMSTGAKTVLAARLTPYEGTYLLTVSELDGQTPVTFRLSGTDLPRLAVDAGRQVARSLGSVPVSGSTGFRRVLSGNAFVDEAFARGLDARLRADQPAARRYFQTVLDADPEFESARYQLSLVQRAMGELDRARDTLEELERRAQDRGDIRMEANAWSGFGILAWRRGDLEAAEGYYRRALQAYRDLDLSANAAGLEVNLGIIAANRGNFDAAAAAFSSSLKLYETVGDRYSQARTLKNLGVLALDRDQLDRGNDHLHRSLELRRELGLDREVAQTLNAIAAVEAARGNFTEAAAFQRQVRTAAREAGDTTLEAIALSELSEALLELGHVQAALDRAAESLAIARSLDNSTMIANATKQLARAHWAAGRLERSRELLKDALAVHVDSGRKPNELSLHLELARLAMAAGRPARCDRHLASARGLIDDVDATGYRAELLWLEARRALHHGLRPDALSSYRQAFELAHSAGLRVKAQRIAAELGMALLDDEGVREELAQLIEEMKTAPVNTPEKFAFLAAAKAGQGRYSEALSLAEQWRQVAGERWTAADQAVLDNYRARAPRS